MKRVILMIITLMTVFSLWAFQFSPLEKTFSPSGEGSQGTYTIVNDTDDSIAVSLSVVQRDQDAAGNEIRKESKEFQVSPSKVVVAPQSSMVVRVKYMGSSTVTVEKPYRLMAEQIPYSQGKAQTEGAMFNFLFVYATSLYVEPSDKVVQVDVPKVSSHTDEEGTRWLDVTVRNRGNVHQILLDATLTVKDSKGNQVTLEGDRMEGISGFNLLARKTVTKSIPWPEELEGPSLTGTLKYSTQ